MKKKILIALGIVLVGIQFFQPAKNTSATPSANHIANKYATPAEVRQILEQSCNDCHSNNTVYPWYAAVQPIAWWLADHVNEGKREINFDEFLTYSPKKAAHKLEEVSEMVKENEMPLKSYTLIHRNAVLTEQEKLALSSWAMSTMDSIKIQNNLPVEEEKNGKGEH